VKSKSGVRFFRVRDEWCVILVNQAAGQTFNFVCWAPGHLDMGPERAAEFAYEAMRAQREKLAS
jgi:hypothetical protein